MLPSLVVDADIVGGGGGGGGGWSGEGTVYMALARSGGAHAIASDAACTRLCARAHAGPASSGRDGRLLLCTDVIALRFVLGSVQSRGVVRVNASILPLNRSLMTGGPSRVQLCTNWVPLLPLLEASALYGPVASALYGPVAEYPSPTPDHPTPNSRPRSRSGACSTLNSVGRKL